MKKRSIIVLTLLAGCFTNSFAQKGEKTLTVEVSNEWTQNKTDEPVVIDLNNLKAGFNIKSATVWEGNKEIPSQLDDLNGDARADELAFLIDMPAKSNKSFRVILSSEKSEKNYPARTYAQITDITTNSPILRDFQRQEPRMYIVLFTITDRL